MYRIRGFQVALTLFFLLPSLPNFAQVNEGMLIFQIDGNRYVRKNYDEKGKMENYQTIEVSNVNFVNGKIEAKMTVINYDSKDNLQSASQTNISCNPKAKEVLMGIFPFAGGQSNKKLKIEMPEGAKLYPAGWQRQGKLADFSFRLNLEGGAAGFFGTSSQVSITERKVAPQSDGSYRVSGKMALKAYVAGFRISTTGYAYSEYIELKKGIVRQKFRKENGESFTITLIEN